MRISDWSSDVCSSDLRLVAGADMSAAATAPSLAPSFWIDFEEARNAVETIVDVAHDDPEERPTCIVLTGQSGMGKTSILREAQRRLAEAFPQPAAGGEAPYPPPLRPAIRPSRGEGKSI